MTAGDGGGAGVRACGASSTSPSGLAECTGVYWLQELACNDPKCTRLQPARRWSHLTRGPTCSPSNLCTVHATWEETEWSRLSDHHFRQTRFSTWTGRTAVARRTLRWTGTTRIWVRARCSRSRRSDSLPQTESQWSRTRSQGWASHSRRSSSHSNHYFLHSAPSYCETDHFRSHLLPHHCNTNSFSSQSPTSLSKIHSNCSPIPPDTAKHCKREQAGERERAYLTHNHTATILSGQQAAPKSQVHRPPKSPNNRNNRTCPKRDNWSAWFATLSPPFQLFNYLCHKLRISSADKWKDVTSPLRKEQWLKRLQLPRDKRHDLDAAVEWRTDDA